MDDHHSSSESEASVTEVDDNSLFFDRVNHGRNVKLEENGKAAQKIKKGAKEAIVVTNRMLQTNELFEVEIGAGGGFKGVKQEVKHMLKGKESIRIGVTVHSPNHIVSQNVQHSMKRMDSGTWMMMAEQVLKSGETVMAYQKYSLKELNIGDRVGIVRLPEFQGSVVIYINDVPIGIIATEVPENLYGFIELQDCERVSITPHRSIEEVTLPVEVRTIREKEEEIATLSAELRGKEEKLDTLEVQLEMLRKQMLRSKSVSQRSISAAAIKAESTQDAETQTEDVLANGGHPPEAEERHSSKNSRCVIS